jgi:hypothetical protein
MNRLNEFAQLLVSSWSLANGDQKRIPSSPGILDKALQGALNAGAFPGWARQELHFVDGRMGLQCIELPAILEWAQRGQLTSAANPSYRFTEVQATQRVARILLRRLGVPEQDALTWGRALKSALEQAVEQEKAFQPV